MFSSLASVGLSFLLCLFISAVLFSILAKNDFLRQNHFSAAISVCCATVIGLSLTISVFWYPFDLINNLKLWQYLLPLISSLLIVASLFVRKPFAVAGAVIAASFISIFGTNINIVILADIPLWANQLSAAIILSIYALGWRTISGLNPLTQIQGSIICIGFLLLYILGLAPLMMGISAAGILACLIIAYLHSKTQPIGLNASPVLGFIIGWLGLIAYNEYLFPCFITFTMLYLLEFVVSIIRFMTLLPKYKEPAYNTITLQAFSDGLSAYSLIRAIWITGMIQILFGLFQTNAENSYSIPVFTAILVSWQLYRILNWKTASQTLKETNRQLIKDIKHSFTGFFDSNEEQDEEDNANNSDKN